MYARFFGLREQPFELRPDPRFLLMTAGHRDALGMLQYGLVAGKGLIVLIGEPGTGKTTLLRAVLSSLDLPEHALARVDDPALTRAEFYEHLAPQLGISPGGGKAVFLAELRKLLNRAPQGALCALLVDEAQSAPAEVLEEIRLVGNVEGVRGRSLSIVLSGQPALAARLNHAALRQLKQRTALRCSLRPLTPAETAAYVTARLRVAGRPTGVFSADALATVYHYSAGIPRTVNAVCDNALIAAYAAGERSVDPAFVIEAARELDLDERGAAAFAGPLEHR